MKFPWWKIRTIWFNMQGKQGENSNEKGCFSAPEFYASKTSYTVGIVAGDNGYFVMS